jgi:tetratricopeptide (TPR) repeat protein
VPQITGSRWPNAEAATWDSLGYAHHHLGNHRQAIACYQRSVDLYRGLADGYNEATTLAALGDAHQDVGHLQAARQAWQTAVATLDRLGHPDADPIRAKLLDERADPGSEGPGSADEI